MSTSYNMAADSLKWVT
ncbi:MAG: hypothetical protein ACLSG8_01010 [Barnesiella sp.]